MRFRIAGLIMGLFLSFTTQAQTYGLEVEVVSENIGPLIGALGVTDLTGFSCTRVYVTMENADDFMSSVSGDVNNPTIVNTTGAFYHAVLGAATPSGINSLLFPVYPDLAYDSWVTIGLEGVPDALAGEAAPSTVQATANPWTTIFDPGGGLPGQSFAIDDPIGGAWYALNGDANGVAGADLKVLVAQFTTNGELDGQLYCQIFINGDGQNELLVNGNRPTYYFGATDLPGCTDATACNYDPNATADDGSCDFSCYGCTDSGACNYDGGATIDDGSCDFSCYGCTDSGACNYDGGATIDDGSCDFSCYGCTDAAACNYDAGATLDDGSCDFSCYGCTDATACNYDGGASLDDGSCDFSCYGCTDATACNYDAGATIDDASCDFSCYGCTDAGACNYDAGATLDDGSCDFSCYGCTDADACNYDAGATLDDGSCDFSCYGCTDAGACNYDADATLDDGSCESDSCAGCTDESACNYDPSATIDDGSCESSSCAGCTDAAACNYDADATIDDGSCESTSCAGCTDAEACNYDDTATIDDGSCTYPADDNLDCDGNCLNDFNENGICDEDESFGCTDPEACNYDADADSDNGSCTYPNEEYLDCDGNCLNDADGDGICDELEVGGCTDAGACNYDADATDDDGSCEFESCAGCTDAGACNYDGGATIDDGSCEYESCAGCTDDSACNYDDAATIDDGSCTYPDADNLDCDGNCLNDADGDLICDEDEIGGCTDEEALNYNADATDDDGSCEYPCTPTWGEPSTYPSVATVLALVTVDGENAAMDDAVGAFVDGELRGEGEIIEFEGATYINMSVYLANDGEMVDFLFFNQDECSTCTMDAGLTADGFGEYGSFADPLMFDANCSEVTLDVDIAEGWNYVSTNITPADYSISSLFEDALDGSLLKVLGDDDFALGGSYTPGIPSVFNSLQMHTDAAGYVIKVDADGIWSSTGAAIDAANTPMDLNEGWNIIGYLPQGALSVEEALASIDGNVGTVIDGQNGTVWNPANPNEFNSLLDLEPGRSYWVRMIEAGTLTYPNAAATDGGGMALAGLRDGDAAQAMTGWNVERAPLAAAVAAEVLLDDMPVDGEAYIGAFLGDQCVAARPVIYFGNTTASQMAVMLENTADVTFKLWVDGEVFLSDDIMTLTGGEERGQGGDVLPIIRFGSETNTVGDSDWITQLNVSPVPTNAEAWVNLNVQEAGQVRITVLDARGAEVAIVHDGQLAAGEHRIMLDARQWAAGTYFVKGIGEHGIFRTPLIVQ